MASSSHDREYMRHCRKMRSGRMERPKRSTFVAHKASWSRKAMAVGIKAVIELSQSFIRQDVFTCAEKATTSRRMLIDFSDSMHPVMDCIEHYSNRMLANLRITALGCSSALLHGIGGLGGFSSTAVASR